MEPHPKNILGSLSTLKHSPKPRHQEVFNHTLEVKECPWHGCIHIQSHVTRRAAWLPFVSNRRGKTVLLDRLAGPSQKVLQHGTKVMGGATAAINGSGVERKHSLVALILVQGPIRSIDGSNICILSNCLICWIG